VFVEGETDRPSKMNRPKKKSEFARRDEQPKKGKKGSMKGNRILAGGNKKGMIAASNSLCFEKKNTAR